MRRWLNLDSPIIKFLSHLFDWVSLNLLFILVCLPVITIPSAWGALLAVNYEQYFHPDLPLHQRFLNYVKQHFKLTLKLTLVELIILAVLVVLPSLLKIDIFIIFQVIGIFLLAILLTYSYILISQFEMSVKDVLSNSLFLFINYPVQTVFLIIINTFVLFLSTTTYIGMIVAIYLFSFVGFVALAKINAFFLRFVLNKVELKKESF